MEKIYEYDYVQNLYDDSKYYITIPKDIIWTPDVSKKRITTFSYMSFYKGVCNKLFFSVNNIVEWSNKTIDRHKGGTNEKIIQSINDLKEKGYILLPDIEKIKHSSFIEVEFNEEKLKKEYNEGNFAVIYLDEIKKIMSFKNSNSKDFYLNSDNLLLIFCYLRSRIHNRSCTVNGGERNRDGLDSHKYDIKKKREISPEVYYENLKYIGGRFDLTPVTISNIIKTLDKLELIYSKPLPRWMSIDENKKEKWVTSPTVFCNYYKRRGNLLLDSGKGYYLNEVKNQTKLYIEEQEKLGRKIVVAENTNYRNGGD